MSYIKLDRKMKTWEWKDNPNMVALWIEILLQANYNESRWHGEVYEKGSFPTSLEKLANATGLTKSQVRTCLKKLKMTHEIAYTSTHQGMKISVIKWAFYQGGDDSDDTQNRTQVSTQLARKSQHLKKYKKERNQEDILPTYDPSTNKTMSIEEEEELLELMKGAA